MTTDRLGFRARQSTWNVVRCTALRALVWGGVVLASPPGTDGTDRLQFNRDIRPILAENCFTCHGFDKAARQADLRLDARDEATAKRDGASAIVPGSSAESELVRRIFSVDESERMPPADSKLRLSDSERDKLRRWIDEGAEYESHWSFLPIRRPPLPEVKRSAWVRNEVDRFVLAQLEELGLDPSPEADRATLIRRVTFDLTGLPPTPEEVDAFLFDSSPDAYERVVDRLLSSPRYGEHMAVDWLDAARYADTHGYQNDQVRHMWPWRDWVIRAFNENLSFDRFVVEQIAGDLLPDATQEQKIATAFNRNHRISEEGGVIDEELRVEYVLDRTSTTATVFLGLTMGCAQCHDHKYDPLTQRDYYRFFAYFNSVSDRGTGIGLGSDPPNLRLASPEDQRRLDELQMAVASAESQLAKSKESGDQAARDAATKSVADAKQRFAALELAVPAVMVMQDLPQPRPTHILARGQYDQPGEAVEPGTPEALPSPPDTSPKNRLGLAQWLVDARNPLTARVAANRFWKQRFGTGIVKTVEDFGTQGDPPSHPDLLDWLAHHLVASGWDVKEFQKALVTSATYRQSSHATQTLLERDPENRWLARGPRFRLSAEQLRDSALAIGGLLVERVGGPPVKPYQPKGLWEELTFMTGSAANYKQDSGDALFRRSLYTFWKRTIPPPSLVAFDAPSRETCTVQRARTNTPLQALVLLNDPTYVEASRALAVTVLRNDSLATPEARLSAAFKLATARQPNSGELAVLARGLFVRHAFYNSHPTAAKQLLSLGESTVGATFDAAELAAYAATAGVILNLDETVTRE